MDRILKDMKLYLFDMDGTLYLGDRLYSFTQELLQTIREKGGTYLFMTNNSSKSVADYIKKLANLGIQATRDDFITSSQATAYYLQKHHKGQTLYVCGTNSLKQELMDNGFIWVVLMDSLLTKLKQKWGKDIHGMNYWKSKMMINNKKHLQCKCFSFILNMF